MRMHAEIQTSVYAEVDRPSMSEMCAGGGKLCVGVFSDSLHCKEKAHSQDHFYRVYIRYKEH